MFYNKIATNNYKSLCSSEDTVLSKNFSYTSVFIGEITTEELEIITPPILLYTIKKDLKEILENNYSKLYNEMFKKEMSKTSYMCFNQDKIMNILCERDISMVNKLKYLNLFFF